MVKNCYSNPSEVPASCPINTHPDAIARAMRGYERDDVRRMHLAASKIEKEGYCLWPRLREVAEFAGRLGLSRIGIAFCIGLSEEARKVHEYLESRGFEVHSVCCKCGGIDKSLMGLSEDDKLEPGTHESICNPLVQAELLNDIGTQLNVIIGLCVGHDTLFIMRSRAPVTYLIAKDRVTGHNPAAAIYALDYFRERLGMP
ncbi:MAG: DUF1847 domain-containing protein [Candidatus Korarchaeota archaeon NZ13-K]|nr:MAG: DUF1847 domain-containing protein [Candidatus Korarchaeota archaeon NZ13-K]